MCLVYLQEWLLFIEDFNPLEGVAWVMVERESEEERGRMYMNENIRPSNGSLPLPLQVGASVGELLCSLAKHAEVGSAQPWTRDLCWMENP